MSGRQPKNAWVAFAATGVVAVMVGMSFAAVPLYQLFCQVTGFGGTTQRAEASGAVTDREVTVTFDANVNKDLPWTFEPVQRKVSLRIGEQTLVSYRAVNNSDRPVTGMATFNVTPFQVGQYFSKIQCFCFNQQTLQPGESVEMPVVFFVDPKIQEERNLADLTDIVLSYTFFRADPPKGGSSKGDRREARARADDGGDGPTTF